MSVRRADNDDSPDMRNMQNMQPRVLGDFEDLCEETYDVEGAKRLSGGFQDGVYHAINLLRERLTGEYTNLRTGEQVKYMMYNIPPSASPELKTFMQRLNRKYEALNPKKRSRSDVDDLPESKPPKTRARIIELS
jgi:hypothetical protein